MIPVDSNEAEKSASEPGEPIADPVTEKFASQRSVMRHQLAAGGRIATRRLHAASKRVAGIVSEQVVAKRGVVKEKLSTGGRAALAMLVTASVKLTRKQLAALEKAESKYSDS